MKTLLMKGSLLAAVTFSAAMFAQETTPGMREYLAPEKYNKNVFEDPKVAAPEYNGVHVSVGGDFAIQFQGLDNTTEGTTAAGAPLTLKTLGTDLNLPTANLDLNAYLAKGIKMHLRTYLSSRHHNVAYVKGGYLQIDNLDFVAPGFLSNVMDHARFKVGMDDINYGDAHFRRSDNAKALNNPFVENNIMDSFTTEPFIEAYGFFNNMFVMGGITNGKLNQSVIKTVTTDNGPTIYAKAGYDKQLNDAMRFRLSGSVLKASGLSTGSYLYGADRAGSRYYYVLLTEADAAGESNFATGRFNPGFRNNLAIQINPFFKYNGLEFFGTIENVSGNKIIPAAGTTPAKERDTDGNYTQLAGELLYRFGNAEQFYLGGKYNTVSGKDYDAAADREINRFAIAGGWFMTPNVLTKVEYVNQTYNNTGTAEGGWGYTPLNGGEFNGFVIEATIGF